MVSRVRLPALLALPLLLAGCLFGGGGEEERPVQRIRPRAGGPVTLRREPTRDTLACHAELAREGVRFTPLPDQDFGSGCLVEGAVRLDDYGLPTSGLKSIRCPLAQRFVAWTRYAVQPAAQMVYGATVVRIETYGTFSCRGIVGNGPAASGRVSQHGLANAVDIAGFTLSDGRKVTVLQGWNGPDERDRRFLRLIHDSACKRFTTVLGPDYNAAHANHFHFDMAGRDFCR